MLVDNQTRAARQTDIGGFALEGAPRHCTLEVAPPEPSGFPEQGSLIGGVYRVTGMLGSGAMGVVLEAEDETLGRTVAIKFIRPNRLDDGFRKRFRSEAQAMARVRHPRTVQIYAYGEHDGAPYFVMEYVPGMTLDQWLARETDVTLEAALEVLAQVCDGVAAIHAESTVHRDLKPSNVIVDRFGNAHVADLGLAVLDEEQGQSAKREVVGTPSYMAPEVATASVEPGESMRRADVYSLGCLAYEALTGELPFHATTHEAMMLAHLTATPLRPSERRRELPALLDDIVLSAMARDPAMRTPTAEAFGVRLREAAEALVTPVRVLLAEDNRDFREALQVALEDAFPTAEIECVDNGKAALAAYDRKRPSIAILDLRMPGFDGTQLTSLLRTRDPAAKMPIIIVSASGGPADWKRLSAMGADRFLVKPIVIDDLVTMVRSVLKERSVAQRLTPV